MPSVAASPLPPECRPVSPEPPQTLLSRDFILLFCMTMFCNSFIAVFYCFEQWLETMTISPNWRGVLLSSMFAMVLLFRPLASVFLLRRGPQGFKRTQQCAGRTASKATGCSDLQFRAHSNDVTDRLPFLSTLHAAA